MRGLPHKDRLVLEGSDEGRAENKAKTLKWGKKI